MKHRYKIGFDIGGTISKFPEHMLALMRALGKSDEFEVFIITDMSQRDAIASLEKNTIPFELDRLLCGDWSAHGDLCKSVLMKKHGIDIMIDDRPDYVSEGVPIGLILAPRPHTPYFHPSWKL